MEHLEFPVDEPDWAVVKRRLWATGALVLVAASAFLLREKERTTDPNEFGLPCSQEDTVYWIVNDRNLTAETSGEAFALAHQTLLHSDGWAVRTETSDEVAFGHTDDGELDEIIFIRRPGPWTFAGGVRCR